MDKRSKCHQTRGGKNNTLKHLNVRAGICFQGAVWLPLPRCSFEGMQLHSAGNGTEITCTPRHAGAQPGLLRRRGGCSSPVEQGLSRHLRVWARLPLPKGPRALTTSACDRIPWQTTRWKRRKGRKGSQEDVRTPFWQAGVFTFTQNRVIPLKRST